ncbi:MAG: type II toxin-antitoxin system ParD family antitoxin [Armatimonadota bacterium]|nr:type II toxin-antitoxin system ParD family antitoxin [Armatimonadota bacterium]
MAVVNISLPEQMKNYVDERLSEGRFSSTSEYFRDLVRDDQKRRAQERLETLLLEGLESGEPIDVTEGYIQQKRAELTKRIGETAKNGK